MASTLTVFSLTLILHCVVKTHQHDVNGRSLHVAVTLEGTTTADLLQQSLTVRTLPLNRVVFMLTCILLCSRKSFSTVINLTCTLN